MLRWGNTAVADADKFGRTDVVEYLIEAMKMSSDSSAISSSYEQSALEIAEPESQEKTVETEETNV